jgi:hypothetical protein
LILRGFSLGAKFPNRKRSIFKPKAYFWVGRENIEKRQKLTCFFNEILDFTRGLIEEYRPKNKNLG